MELLSEEDWTVNENNLVDTGFVKTVWNCFDESALEMMLKLSDLSEGFGVDIQLEAMTVGNRICDKYLKTLYALGFRNAVRIETEEELLFQPELTAGLIAEYWSRYGSQDVIVMGQKSADGCNGKIPLLVAEKLGWACVTQVMEIIPVDETHLKVVSRTDDGQITRIVPIPCVLVVGDAAKGYLRVPTLKERMSRGKRPVELYDMEEFQSWKNREALCQTASLVKLSSVNHTREGKVIRGESLQEEVEILYQSYLRERLVQL